MEFNTIIAAMSRLNSWVRSESFQHGLGGPRAAIYAYKSEVIRHAVDGGCRVALRLIVSAVKCRDCGGSGRYVDQYGHEHPSCRACRGTGTAKLQFVEARFADGPCWHTPLHSWPSCGINAYKLTPEVDSFTPNQIGQDMKIAAAADDLLTVERFLEQSGALNRLRRCRPDDMGYRLHLGKSPRRCAFCDSRAFLPKYGTYLVTSLKHVTWSAHAHDSCFKINGWAFPFKPPGVIADPRIQAWIKARSDPTHWLDERRLVGLEEGVPF